MTRTHKSRAHNHADAQTSLLASESDTRMFSGARQQQHSTMTNCDQSTVVTHVPSFVGADSETVLDDVRSNVPFTVTHRVASGISSAHSVGAYTPSSFDAVSSDCSRTQLLGSHHRYGFTQSVRSSCLHLPLNTVAEVSHTQAASWCFEMCHQNESSFAEPALQALLTRYFANSQRRCLLCFIAVLCALSALLGSLELYYSASLTQRVVYFYAHAAVTLGFAAFLHPGCGAPRRDPPARFGRNRLCTDLFLSIVLVLHSTVFVILNLPISLTPHAAGAQPVGTTPPTFSASSPPANWTTPRTSGVPPPQLLTLADGLWQVLVVIVLLFLFLPLRFYVPLFVATSLTTLHTVTAFLFANRSPDIVWRFVIANLAVAVCVIAVCTWLNVRAEQLQRNVFVHAKSCAESRICLQNAQDRCERLLQVTFPERIASQLTKACIAFGDTSSEKRFAQKRIPACTLLLVDIVGISQLLTVCQPTDLLRIISSLVSAFDIISQQFRCYRLRLLGSSYYAVCGAPDAAADHALCAVQAAFGFLAAAKQFVDETGIKLGVKVVLYSTASATCGVFGVRRMAFDVWCNDLDILNEIRLYTPTSQIGASKSVADQLNGLYAVEPMTFRRLRTYRPDHQSTPADQLIMFLIKQRSAPGRKFSLPQRYFVNSLRAGARSSLVDVALGVQQQRGVMGVLQSHTSHPDEPFADLTEMLLSNTTITANNSVGETRESSFHARVSCDPFSFVSQFNVNDSFLVHFKHALRMQSLGKMRQAHASHCSLAFRSAERERKYQNLADETFEKSILFVLLVLLCNAAHQATVLPRTLFLLLLVLISLAWNSLALIFLLAAKLRCITLDLRRSRAARLVVLFVSVAVFFTMCEVNMLYCRSDGVNGELAGASFLTLASPARQAAQNSTDEKLQCQMPAYLYTNCVFSCLLLAVFTEFSSMLKFAMTGTITIVYIMTVSVVHLRLIGDFDERWKVLVPTPIQGTILVVVFLLLLTIYSVRIEWYRRAQFVWSSQMDEAIQSSTVLHHKLTDAMYNLMPESAFAEYLDGRLRNSTDLYCVTHKRVAVAFVSICGLDGLPSSEQPERVTNTSVDKNKSAESLERQAYTAASGALSPLSAGALLDTVFTTFDTIIAQEKYRLVEKVKSVGATYQLVTGLQLDDFGENVQLFAPYIALMIELLSEFANVLENVSFAHQVRLSLKSGLSFGATFAGVIGGKRIQYELFGDCVLQAFGLVSHAVSRELLCSEEVMQLLQSHYDFDGPHELPAMSTNKKQVTAFRLRGVRRLQLNLPLSVPETGSGRFARQDLPASAGAQSGSLNRQAVNQANSLQQAANHLQFAAPKTLPDIAAANAHSIVETQLWQTQQQVMATFHTSGQSAPFSQLTSVQPAVNGQQNFGSVESHSGSRKKKQHHHKHRHSKAHDNLAMAKSPSGELIQLDVFASNVDSQERAAHKQTAPVTLQSCSNPAPIHMSSATKSSELKAPKLETALPMAPQTSADSVSLVLHKNSLVSLTRLEMSGQKTASSSSMHAETSESSVSKATAIQHEQHTGELRRRDHKHSPSSEVHDGQSVLHAAKNKSNKIRSQSTNSSHSGHSHISLPAVTNLDRQQASTQALRASGNVIPEESLDFPSYKPPAPFFTGSGLMRQSTEKAKPSTTAFSQPAVSVSASVSVSPTQVTAQATPQTAAQTAAGQMDASGNSTPPEADFSLLLRKMTDCAAENDPIMRESRISMVTDDRETELESAAEERQYEHDADQRRDSALQNFVTQSEYESNAELDSDVENCKPSSEISNSDEEERNIKNFYVSDYEPDLPAKRLNFGTPLDAAKKTPQQKRDAAPDTKNAPLAKNEASTTASVTNSEQSSQPHTIVVNRFAEPPHAGGVSKKIQRAKMAALMGKYGVGAGSCTSTLYGSSNERSEYENLDSDFSDRVRIETCVLERLRRTHREMQAAAANGLDIDLDHEDNNQHFADHGQFSNWLPPNGPSALQSTNRSGTTSDYDNNNNSNNLYATGTSSVTSTAHRSAARQRMLQKLGLSRRQSGETTDDDDHHDIPTTTDEEDESEYVSELDQKKTADEYEYDAGTSTDDYMTYSAIFNKLRSANLIKPQSAVGSVSSTNKRHASEGRTVAARK